MTLALIALYAVPARAEVKMTKEQDGAVTIKTGVYAAAFDAKGNLLHVTVKGAVAFSHTFGNPGEPPANAPSVNVINNTVAVRDGNRRVEWTFDEEAIRIVQEGYNFECTLDKSVKALVAPGGKGGALGKYNGGTTAAVLANDLTMVLVKPTHVHERRMLPGGYTNGGLKIGGLFEGEIKLGAPAEAAQFLGGIVISAVGSGHEELLQGGNAGGGFAHFGKGVPIVFTSAQENLANEKMELEFRLSVMDHYVAAKEVEAQKQAATLETNSRARDFRLVDHRAAAAGHHRQSQGRRPKDADRRAVHHLPAPGGHLHAMEERGGKQPAGLRAVVPPRTGLPGRPAGGEGRPHCGPRRKPLGAAGGDRGGAAPEEHLRGVGFRSHLGRHQLDRQALRRLGPAWRPQRLQRRSGEPLGRDGGVRGSGKSRAGCDVPHLVRLRD
jgi:hypothetical protein